MSRVKLSIPQPCSASWRDMSRDENGRFCASCKKTVVDFTEMTDREVGEFLKKSKDKLCGRITSDQLLTTFEIPEKKYSFVRHLLPLSLPALLISAEANSQSTKHQTEMVVLKDQQRLKIIEPVPKPDDSFLFSGKVADANDNPIPQCTILIKGTKKGSVSDKEGNFKVGSDTATPILVISAAGYVPVETKASAGTFLKIRLTTSDAYVMGEVIVVPRGSKKN